MVKILTTIVIALRGHQLHDLFIDSMRTYLRKAQKENFSESLKILAVSG